MCSWEDLNGITYAQGRLARVAHPMQSLGCAVAADKREVPRVDHDVLFIHYGIVAYIRVHHHNQDVSQDGPEDDQNQTTAGR